MANTCNIIGKNLPAAAKTALYRQQNAFVISFFSSGHDATVAPQLDMKDDYVARQFGYRVVPSLPSEGYTSFGEAYKISTASNLDILSSPEVMEILKSQRRRYDTNKSDSLVPAAEAHVDNGYSSDNDFIAESFTDDYEY